MIAFEHASGHSRRVLRVLRGIRVALTWRGHVVELSRSSMPVETSRVSTGIWPRAPEPPLDEACSVTAHCPSSSGKGAGLTKPQVQLYAVNGFCQSKARAP
jgi:hypothetical protein